MLRSQKGVRQVLLGAICTLHAWVGGGLKFLFVELEEYLGSLNLTSNDVPAATQN